MISRLIRSPSLFLLLFACAWPSFGQVMIDEQWLAANGPPPYYLTQPSRTYVLGVDVNTPGTAFAIIAPNVTFDLGDRTITYGDAPPIVVPNGDFETSGGWDLSNAPAAQFAQGTFVQPVSVYSGDYALKFETPVSNQSLQTLSSIVLEPATTYSLSAMFYNHNNNTQAVRLYVKLANTSVEVEQNGITWRGFQYRSASFTTGPTPESHTLVVGIENAAQSQGPVYVDDIRIQRTLNHGVVVGAPGWFGARGSDVTQYGNASNSIVKNGSVGQGQGAGDWSHGVVVGPLNDNVEITGLNVHVVGANGRNIYFGENCDSITIHHNTLMSEVRTIRSRDNGDGVMIRTDQGTSGVRIYGNVLSGGPQSGISLVATADQSLIYDNTISLRGLYSNGFGIVVQNAEAWGNTVNCHTGNFACRGMMVADDSYVHDNVINVRYLPENQEYNGCSLGGAYGIQSEGALNSTVRDNVVTAYSDECEAVAFRINDPWQAGKPWGNIDVFSNQFNAVQQGAAAAYTLRASSLDETVGVQFRQNTLTTNSRWILGNNVYSQPFSENTFVLSGQYEDPFRPFVGGYSSGTAVQDIRLIDSQYGSAAAEDAFLNADWRHWPDGILVDPYSSHVVAWSVTVFVRDGATPIPGATVEILDNSMNTVFIGTTNAQGVVETTVEEFRVDGDQKTVFGPFEFEVTAPAGVLSREVAVDDTMTVEFNYGPPAAELAVEKTADRSFVKNNDPLTYSVLVRNYGPDPVVGADVSDLVPGDVTNVGWTCAPAGGASCSPVGAGDVVDAVNLPVGALVTYTIEGTVWSNAPFFDNTATVSAPSGIGDPDGGNNTATVTVYTCGVDEIVLENTVIVDQEVYVACETITAGPDVQVLGGGDLILRSLGSTVLGEDFSIEDGGKLTVWGGNS